jgi:glycerol-1-phosphate dehydrogenase [NAD(P)+]
MPTTIPGTPASDASTIDSVTRRLAESTHPERLRPIGLRHIVQGPDVLGKLPELVRSLADTGPVLVLADAVPIRRDGRDLKQQVLELLAPFGARLVTVGDHDHEVHADMETVNAASAAVAGAGCVVAVGSGTICDIGKKATEGSEPVPYVVVQTACSVNAFSDDMAVLLLHGAKRTMPSRWPDALVIDLSVIAEAPAALNQAGVGELSSMFTAPADWRLADLMGLDGGYDEAVVGLFRDDGEALEQVAAGVADRDPEALAWLCDRMTRGGLALGVVGRTAPLSGAEHAISHLLDMAAIRTGVATGLHGAQVGVASVVVAAMWQDLLDDFDVQRVLDPAPTTGEARARIERTFGVFDPTGEMAAECWRLYQRKLAAWTGGVGSRATFVADWPANRQVLCAGLLSPEAIVSGLRAAGAPVTFSDLGASADTARWAVSAAHLLRDRFGVLDLLDLTGRWTDVDVDRVLARAASAGGGL